MGITFLRDFFLVHHKSSTFKPSFDTILVFSIDVEIINLHVVSPLLVDSHGESDLIEVGEGGPGLGGEALAGTPAQCCQGPGLLASLGPVVAAWLGQCGGLTTHVNVTGVRANLDGDRIF